MLLTGRVRAGRAALDDLARTTDELGARALVRLARDATRAGWPDASVPTPAPVDVCGGGSIQPICTALGRTCPCHPGTTQDNACYYSVADRVACGLPAAGCSGDSWVTGWNVYHQVCHL